MRAAHVSRPSHYLGRPGGQGSRRLEIGAVLSQNDASVCALCAGQAARGRSPCVHTNPHPLRFIEPETHSGKFRCGSASPALAVLSFVKVLINTVNLKRAVVVVGEPGELESRRRARRRQAQVPMWPTSKTCAKRRFPRVVRSRGRAAARTGTPGATRRRRHARISTHHESKLSVRVMTSLKPPIL